MTASLAVYYAIESCVGAAESNLLALGENLAGYVVFLVLAAGLVAIIRPIETEPSVGSNI